MVLTIWPNRLADIRCFGRSILERRNLAIVVSLQRADPRKMVLCHAFADKHQIPFLRHSKPYEWRPWTKKMRKKVVGLKKGSNIFFYIYVDILGGRKKSGREGDEGGGG